MEATATAFSKVDLAVVSVEKSVGSTDCNTGERGILVLSENIELGSERLALLSQVTILDSMEETVGRGGGRGGDHAPSPRFQPW